MPKAPIKCLLCKWIGAIKKSNAPGIKDKARYPIRAMCLRYILAERNPYALQLLEKCLIFCAYVW